MYWSRSSVRIWFPRFSYMTTCTVPAALLPSATVFLNTVAPGFEYNDENLHFPVPEDLRVKVDWPLTGNHQLVMAPQYLNVSRPPLDLHQRNELTTYVPLPHHITSIFHQMVAEKDPQKQLDGSMHIGASVNPLVHDAYKLVHMNPGCCNVMVDLTEFHFTFPNPEARNTLNKVATSFNRLLKINGPKDTFLPIGHDSAKSVFDKVLSNVDKYWSQIGDASTSCLLVSGHVNILNVFAIDTYSQFRNTRTERTDKPVVPVHEDAEIAEYDKVVEDAIFRVQLNSSAVITSIRSFCTKGEPYVVVGLIDGTVVVINLVHLTFRSLQGSDNAVTAIEPFSHPKHDVLLATGYANGDVALLDPFDTSEPKPYVKQVDGADDLVTYFRKFDLSPTGAGDGPLVGHFKLSHKPITSISTTLPVGIKPGGPMLLAIGSDDGITRLVDLIFTHDSNYGTGLLLANCIVSDMIPNYFHDGVCDLKFSPDFKFLVVVGKGDLMEVFKMTYYNVNGLVKSPGSALLSPRGRRSRSDTVNSQNLNPNPFLLPITTQSSDEYPPIVKDVRIVGRFKGHINTVHLVQFVDCDTLHESYKLVSTGDDARVIVWDFDYRVLPKVKKQRRRKPRKPVPTSPAIPTISLGTLPSPPPVLGGLPRHTRARSWNFDDSTIPSMNRLFGQQAEPETPPLNEQAKIVQSVYRLLMEVRLKKHYGGTHRLPAVVHPIVQDKEVPSIEVPLVEVDVASFVSGGKLDGIYVGQAVWVFAKSGDVFRLDVEAN